MSIPPDRSNSSSTEVAAELCRLRETLLISFSVIFLLAGLAVKEFGPQWHPRSPYYLSNWCFLAAVLFFLLFLRSWWPRVLVRTALYKSIMEAYATAQPSTEHIAKFPNKFRQERKKIPVSKLWSFNF